MIYELRVYHCLPNRLPALLKRFENQTLRIWEKHGIRQAGFWTTVIGESNHDLTYLLAWESLAEREKKWAAFQSDPEWIAARDAKREGRAHSRHFLELDPAADVVLERAVGRFALLGAAQSSGCAAPNHANDPDQQTGADEAEDQVADPSAKHDPKNTENGAGDRRADDAEHDIHQQAHIALHELLG